MTKPDSTKDEDDRQYLIPNQSLGDYGLIHAWLDVCPHAQTMTAEDVDRHESLIYALPCNQWSCRHCALRKTRALAYRTERAAPRRLCTLTVDPALYTTPRDAFDKTRRQLPEWIKRMRKRYGEVEYLRVTEVTRKGWPHYHLLIRSGFIPQPVARDEWFLLTGATIVDLRKVDKVFNTYQYLIKYLTKLHHITWTGRHVSYSREFFVPKDWSRDHEHNICHAFIHACHPATYLLKYSPGTTFERVSPRSWRWVYDPDCKTRVPPPPGVQTQAFDTFPQFPGQDDETGGRPCELEPE